MYRTTRSFLLSLIGAAVLVTAGTAPVAQEKFTEGKEWLAWSPAEREIYVHGFIEGYWRGSDEACKLSDKLFEVSQPHRVGEEPSGRCEARLESYTKIKHSGSAYDFSSYVQVLTDFYEKHAEYQRIPKVYLMAFLSDRNYKTADQLYQMALKGELRTNF